MAWYTGKVFRGVDYNPTWPGWNQGPNGDPSTRLQTFDSDMFNDAFASLWGKGFQTPPASDTSAPINNGTNYRDDLGTIASEGFNLVRLYNWGIARGTDPSQAPNYAGLDHVNFLNYAKTLGITVVVPVSDYFLTNDAFSWNNTRPDASYSFGSATADIQSDLDQFIASITDPSTGKIFTNVQISVGNEGDIGEGGVYQGNNSPPNTNASDFLARTIWWIHNLHEKINGQGGVNGPAGDIVPITSTFANADQGATQADPTHPGKWGSWMNWVLSGVEAGQHAPVGWNPQNMNPPGQIFANTVTGLASIDPDVASYYYNSFNIGQAPPVSPFGNGIAETLALYDSAASPWPGGGVANVPLMLMEVFNTNRNDPAWPNPTDQALSAVNEAKTIESYLALHNADTARSTTSLIGYNYFEFTDEPAAGKFVGLYQYGSAFQNAQTGTSSIFYDPRGGYPNFTFPVYELVATPGPGGQGTLAGAWTAQFPNALNAHNDAFVVLQGHSLTTGAPLGVMSNDVSEASGAVALLSGVKSGLLGLGLDGAVTYTPKAGFFGVDTFSYAAFGEYGAADRGEATIHVVPVIAGPTTTTLNLLALTAEEQVASTYAAFFGRAADAAGFEFWVDEFNHNLPTQGPAAVFANIAHSFAASAEATALYPFLANPAGASDAQIGAFLGSVYNNLFDRTPDAAGSAYWTGQIKQVLQAGQSVGQVLINIISGAQDTAAAKDITALMSKVAVSIAYVGEQVEHGIEWAGASDIAVATALLDGVTTDPQSLLVGIRNAEVLIANHA